MLERRIPGYGYVDCLPMWFYFYITPIRDPLTLTQHSDGDVEIHPGTNRFIGRSIRGDAPWAPARIICIDNPWMHRLEGIRNEELIGCREFEYNQKVSPSRLLTTVHVPMKAFFQQSMLSSLTFIQVDIVCFISLSLMAPLNTNWRLVPVISEIIYDLFSPQVRIFTFPAMRKLSNGNSVNGRAAKVRQWANPAGSRSKHRTSHTTDGRTC